MAFFSTGALNIQITEGCVKKKRGQCVSKVRMSPITAELKCPHGRGKDSIESEAVTEAASHEDGGGREDHLGVFLGKITWEEGMLLATLPIAV
jgi:hypothetical protein